MNDAFTLIENIASLRDHLKKWAEANARDPAKVDEAIRSSPDLCIIMDLWNTNKHGGFKTGWSGRLPRLDAVDRGLRLRTLPKKNSWVAVQEGSDGRLRSCGNGTATVDTSGSVRDGHGTVIGDLLEIAERAIESWEHLLVTYEIGRGFDTK